MDFVGRGFTGFGKILKTVILSAAFARRIPLRLSFWIKRDSSLRSEWQPMDFFRSLFSRDVGGPERWGF